LQGGSNGSRGLSPPSPLTLSTVYSDRLRRGNALEATCFLGSATPYSKGRTPALRKFFWTPAYAHAVGARTTKFITVTHAGEMRVSRRSATYPTLWCGVPAVSPEIFGAWHDAQGLT